MTTKKKKKNNVFILSAILLSLSVILGVFIPEVVNSRATKLFEYTSNTYGFMYLLSTVFFMVFCLFLAFSPYGNIKLGKDNEVPKYSFFTWIGMLFSAGFGIGLVFWGVAEPMTHFLKPPVPNIESNSLLSSIVALRYSMFHWGIHQWSVFTVVGLCLAFFQFRKGSKGLISSVLQPVIGDRFSTPIDTLAVIATVTGMATSLGLGVLQINGGLHYVFGIPIDASVQILIMIVLVFLYLSSSITGLDKGIRVLSNINLSLTFLLLLFVLLLGPSVFILKSILTGIYGYLNYFAEMSFPSAQSSGKDWTVFYWAWAIAWAPFVGGFIARVSRGRTIREFVLGVLFVPAFVAIIWMAVMGGASIYSEVVMHIPISSAVEYDVSTALFVLLEQFPFFSVVSVVTIILIITFLVTSADSSTFVLGMMTSDGSLDPSIKVKLFWGILQAAIASVLLASSGLQGLQTASLLAALPFTIILVIMCFSLFITLKKEIKK